MNKMRIEMLMEDGCPIDLNDAGSMLDDLNDFHNRIGQGDGYWKEGSPLANGEVFADSDLIGPLRPNFKEGYIPEVSKKVAEFFKNESPGLAAHDLAWMSHAAGAEVLAGTVVFAVVRNGVNVWMVSTMLFPEVGVIDCEAVVCFFMLNEVFLGVPA
jgi:hypothetical protein